MNLLINMPANYFIRSALKGKGGQWTAANLDKYLKSPADYAPGKIKRH